ncbi:ATP-grasp domain-containing protein [Senegalia sp. (in: firmicutes)]|uniref:ATP-grasp domain-containing protein n=1 Tax=Senegalia sp. (in: firmicutes) TaxID=1924098 RepID=UPI003F9BB4ED
MKLGILNEFTGSEKNYIKACESLGVEYELVDIISTNWIDNIKNSNCDGFLVKPSAKKEVWKNMYDEKLYFINKIMKKPIYPSYEELFIYENKKNMAYWLEVNDIPHPKTWVFYKREEALKFIKDYNEFPIMFKTNIGSAALGVKFIKNEKEAIKLINKIFTRGKFFNIGYTKWYKTSYGISYPRMDDKQYNFIIFQEKLDVKVEWRMINIGDSFFGHQKLSDGKFHSGSDLVGWVKPPEALLNLTKEISKIGNFTSMAIDIFEDINGNYYVNELQTMFGSYNPSQMYINDVPGRYTYNDGKWEFEEGLFNENASCNLRVIDFIERLEVLNQDNK